MNRNIIQLLMVNGITISTDKESNVHFYYDEHQSVN